MFSPSRGEGKVISDATRLLKNAGYEVARQIALPSGSTTGPDIRIDLVGRSDRGIILIETKTVPVSGAAIYAYAAAVNTLTQNVPTSVKVKAFLVTRISSAELIGETLIGRLHLTISSPEDFVDKLKEEIETQEPRDFGSSENPPVPPLPTP
jgi:Holliday junction resolvase